MATTIVDKTVTEPTLDFPHTESFSVDCDLAHTVNVDLTIDIGRQRKRHVVFTNADSGTDIAEFHYPPGASPGPTGWIPAEFDCGQGERIKIEARWTYERPKVGVPFHDIVDDSKSTRRFEDYSQDRALNITVRRISGATA